MKKIHARPNRKSPKDPFGNLVEHGIKPTRTYLQDIEKIREKLKEPNSPSYANAIELIKLGRKLWRLFRLFDTSNKLLRSRFPEEDRRFRMEAGSRPQPRSMADTIVDELFACYLLEKPPLRADRNVLREIVGELIERGAKTKDIRCIFESVLGETTTPMLLIWDPWFEAYREFDTLASNYIRAYKRLEPAVPLLPPPAARSVEMFRKIQRILSKLRKGRPNIDGLKITYKRLRTTTNTSISGTWNPLMKQLEKLLLPFYPFTRSLEYPGGLARRAGEPGPVPEALYCMLNRILNFCFPHVWPYDKPATQNIKMRCHQSGLK